MNLRAMQEVNTGFGDGLAAAFEMLAGPAIFGFLGHLLDQKLGIGPVFLLIFSHRRVRLRVLEAVRYATSAEMDRHLAEAPLGSAKHGAGRREGS